jgi:hypothetical protein
MNRETQTIGSWLSETRAATPKPPSFRKLSLMLYDRSGVYAPSDETIRRWHSPDADEVVDLFHLGFLAEIYGRRISELPPKAATAITALRDSVAGNACPGAPA